MELLILLDTSELLRPVPRKLHGPGPNLAGPRRQCRRPWHSNWHRRLCRQTPRTARARPNGCLASRRKRRARERSNVSTNRPGGPASGGTRAPRTNSWTSTSGKKSCGRAWPNRFQGQLDGTVKERQPPHARRRSRRNHTLIVTGLPPRSLRRRSGAGCQAGPVGRKSKPQATIFGLGVCAAGRLRHETGRQPTP